MTSAYGKGAPFYMEGPGSATDLAKRIREMSSGRLNIQVFGAGELIPAFEGFDAVRAGTVTEEWVRDKTRQLGVSVNVITVDEDAKGVEMVRSRQADAFFAERVILLEQAGRGSKDLVVLERDPTTAPPDTLRSIRVHSTWLAGEARFQ
jgi:hypothetical protein